MSVGPLSPKGSGGLEGAIAVGGLTRVESGDVADKVVYAELADADVAAVGEEALISGSAVLGVMMAGGDERGGDQEGRRAGGGLSDASLVSQPVVSAKGNAEDVEEHSLVLWGSAATEAAASSSSFSGAASGAAPSAGACTSPRAATSAAAVANAGASHVSIDSSAVEAGGAGREEMNREGASQQQWEESKSHKAGRGSVSGASTAGGTGAGTVSITRKSSRAGKGGSSSSSGGDGRGSGGGGGGGGSGKQGGGRRQWYPDKTLLSNPVLSLEDALGCISEKLQDEEESLCHRTSDTSALQLANGGAGAANDSDIDPSQRDADKMVTSLRALGCPGPEEVRGGAAEQQQQQQRRRQRFRTHDVKSVSSPPADISDALGSTSGDIDFDNGSNSHRGASSASLVGCAGLGAGVSETGRAASGVDSPAKATPGSGRLGLSASVSHEAGMAAAATHQQRGKVALLSRGERRGWPGSGGDPRAKDREEGLQFLVRAGTEGREGGGGLDADRALRAGDSAAVLLSRSMSERH